MITFSPPLLAHGADRAFRNRSEKTALDYVRRPEIRVLLAVA